jgi:hypothetical protein
MNRIKVQNVNRITVREEVGKIVAVTRLHNPQEFSEFPKMVVKGSRGRIMPGMQSPDCFSTFDYRNATQRQRDPEIRDSTAINSSIAIVHH